MTHSVSHLSALLLSNDRAASSTSVKILEAHGFRVSKTEHAELAQELCRGKRFDLAIYDQDSAANPELASAPALFSTPHVVLGLVDANTSRQSVGNRIHFVVQKPFTTDLFTKTLKAAYGAIALGRRLSLRHEVNINAISCCVVHRHERRRLRTAMISNLSQTGMCLLTGEMLPQHATIEIRFSLPSGPVVEIMGTVIWAHTAGRAGIQFRNFNSSCRVPFRNWLDSMSPCSGEPMEH